MPLMISISALTPTELARKFKAAEYMFLLAHGLIWNTKLRAPLNLSSLFYCSQL